MHVQVVLHQLGLLRLGEWRIALISLGNT